MKSLYENPIVCPNYIEFRFLSPETGKMKRYRWTFDAGKQSVQNRPSFLKTKCAELTSCLQLGFNPNLHSYKSFLATVNIGTTDTSNDINILAALDDVKENRSHYQKKEGFRAVAHKIDSFKSWLYEMDLENFSVYQIERKHLQKYLGHLDDRKLSPRTKWNHVTMLSSVFEDFDKLSLVDEIRWRNPWAKIPRRTAQAMSSSARIIYSEQQIKAIKKYFEENDPYTLDFIRFITYAFMRPGSTIRQLKVGMIDLQNRQFNITGSINKTGERDTRLIQEILVPTIERMNLAKYPSNYYLFSIKGVPSEEPVGINYFPSRFRKMKKALQIPKGHDMYSLRHTFATDLVRSGTPWHKIMKITGHKTLTAFERYVRFINAEKGEDLSDAYSLKL